MAAAVAKKPAGRVSQVFEAGAARQGAYDLLEHEGVTPAVVSAALFDATARACRFEDLVLIAVDGSSLTLTDENHSKGLGTVGTFQAGAQGLKVMNALALRADGTTIGVIDQVWWTRKERVPTTGYRAAATRESVHWRTVVTNVTARFAELAPKVRVHFLFDREGDASVLLRQLIAQRCEFTCRARHNRKVVVGGRRCNILPQLRKLPPLATSTLALPATAKRGARTAHLEIRAAPFSVSLRDHQDHKRRTVAMTAVWVHEPGRSVARGGLEWFLYTNVTIDSATTALAAVTRYTRRWRIEEFHRTWKRGLCRVEDTQLRSPAAVIKWATLLAAVATRADQLRLRARSTPDAAATDMLSPDEVLVLVTLRNSTQQSGYITAASAARHFKQVSGDGLTLATAVLWIASLGGYVPSKTGVPGTVTIGRGLQRLLEATELVGALRSTGKMR